MKNINNCLSLTGKKTIFNNNLEGKPLNFSGKKIEIPYPILRIKKRIIDLFIIPIHLQKWKKVKENIFQIGLIKDKIEKYQKIYPKEDLEIYDYLMKFVTSIFSEHIDLEELEKKIYGSDENTFASLIHKTPYVRLKAEYEIYHLLYGKPNRKEGEIYDESKLKQIIVLLKNDEITFDEIKDSLNN